jgi:hypothetical protein
MLRILFISMLAIVSAIRDDDPIETEKEVFHDPFSGKLAASWTWVREAPGSGAFAVAGSAMHKSWRVFKNGLVMRVLPGYLHAGTNNSSNILLRPVPGNGDQPLAIEVSLESHPKVPYEHAGLVWYYDDDHYVGLFREFLGTRPQVLMVTEKRARPTFHYGVHEDNTIYLRLEIAGGKITGKFRGDPEEGWTTVGQSDLPLPARPRKPRVGLHTGGCRDGASFVRFWDFRILESQKKDDENSKDNNKEY